MSNHYKLLNISDSAPQAEIEQAYHRTMALVREKIAAGDAPSPESFARLNEAFAVLRDPEQRARYDHTRREKGFAESTTLPTGEPLRFSFTGSGGEYFRIWIVNLLLSILTLGIYSAWAKVRREQYFHRNLILDGSGFDYHGTPGAILKGRIIALVLFSVYSFAQQINVWFYLGSLVFLAAILPWMIVRAYRFRARNTSYRGLRFSFDGHYGGAFKAFVAYGVLTLFTFYLAVPQWLRQLRMYVLNNTRYGKTGFALRVATPAVYKVILGPLLMLAALTGIVVWLVVGQPPMAVMFFFMQNPALAPLAALSFMALFVLAFFYMRMRFLNVFWNHTSLGPHTFRNHMRFRPYIGILLKNWLLMILTVGLYWPWAQINLACYRASCLELDVAGNLDQFVAAAGAGSTAIGDEAADMFDMDVGF